MGMENLQNSVTDDIGNVPAHYVASLEYKANRMKIAKPTKTICKAIRKLAFLGLNDKEICDFLGISPYTFGHWKRDEKFIAALQQGRVHCVANVANSLYKRAVGWSHDDVHIVVVKGEVIQVPIKKHYAPDVAAAQFILKNKTRVFEQSWNDVSRTEHTGEGGGPIKLALNDLDTSHMSLEELVLLQKLVPQLNSADRLENDYDEFEMIMNEMSIEKETTTKYKRTR